MIEDMEGAAPPAAPSPVETAWLAGIFEGEGSVYLERQQNRGATADRYYTGLKVDMTDEDVVARFAGTVGFGNVYPIPPRQSRANQHLKREYRWQCRKLNEVTTFLRWIHPHMGVRRRAKIAECLAADTRLK